MLEEKVEAMSDVARLRQQIALECEAMHLLMNGYAVVARHEIIAHHFEVLTGYQMQLETAVGSVDAARITAEVYTVIMEKPVFQVAKA